MALFLWGKHFCQGLKGRERMMKRRPPKIRRAPAEPTQATDQDSSWCKGMEWSLDSKASTDWWNIRTERRTRTPAQRSEQNHVIASSCHLEHKQVTWQWGPTWEDETEGGWFEKELLSFTEGHGDADGAHHHHAQTQKGQDGRCNIQICEGEKESGRNRSLLERWQKYCELLCGNRSRSRIRHCLIPLGLETIILEFWNVKIQPRCELNHFPN